MKRTARGRRRFADREMFFPESLEVRLNLSAAVLAIAEHVGDDDSDAHHDDDYETEEGHETDSYESFETSDSETDDDHLSESASRLDERDDDNESSSESDWEYADDSEYAFAADYDTIDHSQTTQNATLTDLADAESDESYSEDHGDFVEDPHFEELEALVEDAHEGGTAVQLEDHHVELIDDVIAHLADELLVPEDTLNQLVVPPQSAVGTEPSSVILTSFALDAVDEETAEQPAAPPETDTSATLEGAAGLQPSSSSSKTAENADDSDRAEDSEAMASEEARPDPAANGEEKGQARAAGRVAERIARTAGEANDKTAEDVAQDAELSDAAEVKIVAEGEADAGTGDVTLVRAVGPQHAAVLPSISLGLRYGAMPGLLATPLRQSAVERGFSGDVATAEVSSADSSYSSLVALAVAAGLLAAANADESPAVHRIIRRIRRAIFSQGRRKI